MTDNQLAIAIVTFNSADHIVECVNELRTYDSDVLIVVRDNASTDETPALLLELKSEAKVDDVIFADANAGFAVAVNDIIRRAPMCDILLINPDARVNHEAIALMRQAAKDEPGLGLIAPLVRGNENIKVMSAGRLPTLWPMFTHYSGLSRIFPKTSWLRGRHLFLDAHAGRDQDVEWTSGCCVLIPRRTIDRVGVLSERWFMYGEDTEYCKRTLDAGLSIKILSNAHAFHEVGASANNVQRQVVECTARTPPLPHSGARTASTDVMWAKNLYDFYISEYRPSFITRLAWKMVFTVGNASRATVRLTANPTDHKAKRLLRNAFAVWT